MKIKLFVILVCCFLSSKVLATQTQISYQANKIDSVRWEYTYDVMNIGLAAGIEEFTVYFDHGLYNNLSISTPDTPSEWDQIIWQVEPILGDPGGYDALAATSSVNIGEMIGGFSVTFDWYGVGQPSSQYYEIIDPVTFKTIESGYTVPEPAVILFLLSGGVFLVRKKK